MIMTEKFKILAQFIKDASSETADIETYLFVKENISKYQLNIDITSKALKNKLVEINTTLKFEDKESNEKKSYYEIVYASIIKINDEVKEKKDLEKIILCDVPSEIYPELEQIFLNLLDVSGYPGVKFEKRVNFENAKTLPPITASAWPKAASISPRLTLLRTSQALTVTIKLAAKKFTNDIERTIVLAPSFMSFC